MKKTNGKPKLATPNTFHFGSLEDQTAHALHTLRVLEHMFSESPPSGFEDEDYEAVAGLLLDTQFLLEPLDLQGVAGGLDTKRFSMVHDREGGRPMIACTRCSQEKGV